MANNRYLLETTATKQLYKGIPDDANNPMAIDIENKCGCAGLEPDNCDLMIPNRYPLETTATKQFYNGSSDDANSRMAIDTDNDVAVPDLYRVIAI